MVDSSKERRNLRYIKALIIVADKTGYKICQYIKQNLKLNVKLYDCTCKNIMEVLNDNEHGTLSKFSKNYMVETNKNTGLEEISDFKIYIVMNLDCFSTDEEREKFLDKSMFKNHWAYDYIRPIYNDENLREILLESNTDSKIEIRQAKEYIKIFPLTNKFHLNIEDREEVEILKSLIQNNKKTNLSTLLDYCLNLK